jgi:uncharacterized RDD family membrane protein YckC
LIDGALAGPLPEEIARSLIDHGVPERVVRAVLADIDVEATVRRLAEDADLERLLTEAVDSPEGQRLLERVVASPAIQTALARQSVTFASRIAAEARGRAAALDDRVEQAVRRALSRPQNEAARAFGGVVSRAVGLSLDLAATLAGLAVVSAVLGLIASLAGNMGPSWLGAVLVGGGWVLLADAYLVFFWTVAGQTPGMRVMGLRVVDPAGKPPSAGRAVLRVVGLALSIAPCFAGFIPILFSDRRRGLHDYIAGTAVVRDSTP